MIQNLKNDLKSLSNKDKAKILQWFFKTWVWEYWEWDIFLWITVPELRELSKKYKELSFENLEILLSSKIHEERFLALAILRLNFCKTSDISIKNKIFEFSYKNIFYINNWDLVDSFIPYVWWEYLFGKDKDILYKLVKSNNLWERRISIMTTFYFLKHWNFTDTIKICEILIQDKHDLIHKATGWMLREIWKIDQKILCDFLDKYSKIMPRTTLRYSIERLEKDKKVYYMNLYKIN